MASTRPPRTVLCGHCGASLAVQHGAAASRSVRCPLCHNLTSVDQQRHGLRKAVGFLRAVFANMADGINTLVQPPPTPRAWSPSSGSGLESQIPASYPRVRGKKRALLVGINYASTKYELKGTVNDVNYMRQMLCDKFNFPPDCILILTEEETDPYKVPKKDNLLLAMRWLVRDCTSGDSLVFHFSGHGVQKLDKDGDEVDGYDEALCPLDFEESGVILDDEVNKTIVRPLGLGVKLHAIVDTCHSGTILDLPYLCRISRTGHWQWENHDRPSVEQKSTGGGLAILISGCRDKQTSADTTALSGGTSTGAMTYSFIHAVKSEPGTTYGRLLTAMRAIIRNGDGTFLLPGPFGSFVRRVITFSSVQEPQLSSSEKFDIYRKPFLL